MEPTASDPSVSQQYGMVVGIPNAGQVNALATLNIRGERSVTCKGEFDRHPVARAAAAGRAAGLRIFRHLPDALERAAELDAQYGRNPDLETMPMYGVVFSFKDPFDTKDMRSTGGGDAAYDIDFPARDHVLVEQLRKKGAIIFAKAVCTEYNGRAGNPGGRHTPDKVLPSTLGYQRSTWGGNPSNPYDTTRAASLGSSSGSALSVSTNLVMASLGEETRASCRGPSNHNAVALILPHKAMLGFDGGAIGADIYCDRSGIHCRTIADCAKVLDALKDPENGYYDPRDVFTTVPRSSVLDNYAGHARALRRGGRAEGHAPRRGARVDGLSRPARRPSSRSSRPPRARSRPCSAAISARRWSNPSDPLWTPDPDIEQMTVDFRKALARLVPVFMPDILFRLDAEPASRCSRTSPRRSCRPNSCPANSSAPAPCSRSTTWWRMAEGRIAPPANLDLATIQQQELANTFRFHISQYLTRRAADWAGEGLHRDASPTGRRSTRARSSGATTSAPPSRTGRRSPTRAIRSAAARASTSASCCASCCAAPT